MPDISVSYRIAVLSRQFPELHGIIKALRRFFFVTVPQKWFGVLRVFVPESWERIGPPKGSFSIFNAMRFENRPVRIALTDQGAPVVREDSLMPHSGMHHHVAQPWPVFWSRHKNARLVSTSLALLDEKKRLCRESAYNDPWFKEDPAWNYALLPPARSLRGNWTSVVSRWAPANEVPLYSHWILDALPRLAMMSEFPPDTGILVPFKLAGYQKETLSLMGLLDRIRYTPETHVVVENYYFSSPTAMVSCYNPYGAQFLRSALMPKADKTYKGPKRFLIARRGKSRGIKNQEEVHDFFKSLGWEIIDTEKLTFAQELTLFAEAEAYAGILGSGFTNALWSSPGCKALTFVANSWADGWYEWICQAAGVEYYSQKFPDDHAMMATVDIPAIKQMLKKAGL
jgi:hypothetical protein